MPVHLVNQLRFARHEFQRCIAGVSEEDAVKRLLPMNCISWMVGHLAVQENAYWVYLSSGEILHPEVRELTGYGRPASTPPLADMQAAWKEITERADQFLDALTLPRLGEYYLREGQPLEESIGTLLQRNIYHYWFHTGEAYAVRQMLGHTDLPEYVGDMNGYFFQVG